MQTTIFRITIRCSCSAVTTNFNNNLPLTPSSNHLFQLHLTRRHNRTNNPHSYLRLGYMVLRPSYIPTMEFPSIQLCRGFECVLRIDAMALLPISGSSNVTYNLSPLLTPWTIVLSNLSIHVSDIWSNFGVLLYRAQGSTIHLTFITTSPSIRRIFNLSITETNETIPDPRDNST
jgi:hypothetical protein